jgi:hypothetical protein
MFFEKRQKKKKTKKYLHNNKKPKKKKKKEGRKEGIVERRGRGRGPVRARWVVVAETLRHKSVHGNTTRK